MKRRHDEPLERQEAEVRRMLESELFRSAYPKAYVRWSEAEGLLWAADSEREFHDGRPQVPRGEAGVRYEVVQRYQPGYVDTDPAKVNRRLGAVIAEFLPSLGEARANLLKALGDYSEATMDAIQRQEHGGQKEGHALTWMDARRVVFHSASVMYEFAVSFEEAEPDGLPVATLEPGQVAFTGSRRASSSARTRDGPNGGRRAHWAPR